MGVFASAPARRATQNNGGISDLASRYANRAAYEDREAGSSAPMLILAAVALFGLALLMLYICLAAPQQGTGMGEIRDVMRGLGGDLAVALPLILVWGGVLCINAARGRRVSPLRAVADLMLFVCLFTAVHVFFAERVIRERMTITSFANFVSKSYGYGAGGGALGALLAWPLYRNLGVAGGFIGALLIAVLLLTATGRMGRFFRFVGARSVEARERREDRREFEDFDERPQPRRAARATASRDPYSESLLGGAGEQPARQRRTSARGEQPNRGAARRPAGSAAADAPDERPARTEKTSSRRRGTSAPAASRVPERGRAAAASAPRKRKKLYIENVEDAQEQAPPKDALFDDFDDFDRLEAESAARDKAEKASFEKADRSSRRAFKPDRPSMLREDGGIIDIPDAMPEDIPQDIPADIPVVKADKKSNVSIDDLKIQPEAYEVPDEDEPPFDIPGDASKAAPGIAEKKLGKIKRAKEPEPAEDEPPVYNYPPIDLLARGEVEDVSAHGQRDMQKAKLLEDTLQSFGISAKLTGIAHGPAVTRFELQPAPGVKVSRITSLADDIALNLAAMSVRIEAPIPGKAAVGVEIPNDKVEMVRLRDVLESSEARKHPSRIAVGLGKDNSGRYIVADIAKMPHVLIAGQTGSGKSVCINAIITSILFRSSPEEVKLILIDPKVVELSIYNDIPHLVCPVVTDPKKAASALDWAVAEMTKRYKLFAERGVRDIKGYNKALKKGEKLMPQMVIIIDELADLMMVSPGEVEDSICRLAQLARACGMHLVIATQRPSVNVITGIIKANIPTRIAFSVASQVDSRTMIDHGGAEKLLGNGDMLFVPNGMKSMRVQGAWVSDDEVHAIVEYIKQSGGENYDPDMIEHMEKSVMSDAEKEEFESEYDPKLAEAVDIAIDLGQVSISMLQRKMRIGYARAGRIIDEMSRRGIVSEADGSKPRSVLITREQAQAMFEE